MSYQDIRGMFEARVMGDLRTAGIAPDKIFFDGIGETPGKADEPYAVVSLSFGQTVQDVLSCEGIESLQGTISVSVYTPKNRGSKPGEDICLEVIKGWNVINGYPRAAFVPGGPVWSAAVRNIEGPTTIAPDARPHHVNNINARFTARAA